jgi:hypothetical protein
MFERRKLIFAGALTAVVLAFNWLIAGETSPLYDYFIWHVGLPNFWASLNTLPYIVALLSRSVLVYLLAFAAQWFIIGLLLSSLLKRKSLQ